MYRRWTVSVGTLHLCVNGRLKTISRMMSKRVSLLQPADNKVVGTNMRFSTLILTFPNYMLE